MQTNLRGRDMITTQEWTKDEVDTVLDLALDLDDDAKEHLKQATRTATLWLAPDGLPLAAEFQSDMKGRVLLILSLIHI